MRRKSWLLLAIVPVLLATYTLRRSPIPAPVSGGEASSGTEAPTETPLVWLPPPTVEDLGPQPMTPAPDKAEGRITGPVPDADVSGLVAATLAEQEELRAIDTYAAEERQKIEAWYADQLVELKKQVEQILQELDGEDKLAWSRFYQRANETWTVTDGYAHGMTYDSGFGSTSGFGSGFETTQTFVKGNPAGEYEATLNWIRESKRTTQQDFVNIQNRLAWIREQKLAGVQNEVDRRKLVVALRRSRVQMETTRKSSGDPTPTVEAVATTADNRFFALIGDAFVYEGGVVKGYRVRKIHADSVEFEKDGKTWVQKVE